MRPLALAAPLGQKFIQRVFLQLPRAKLSHNRLCADCFERVRLKQLPESRTERGDYAYVTNLKSGALHSLETLLSADIGKWRTVCGWTVNRGTACRLLKEDDDLSGFTPCGSCIASAG